MSKVQLFKGLILDKYIINKQERGREIQMKTESNWTIQYLNENDIVIVLINSL